MQGPDRLIAAAREVLDANWVGRATVPSGSLYPHQWSWDSAFIAIGRSWYDQARAQTELESLFAAQWVDGRVPHIVFNPDVPRDAYFPGPDFWQSSRAPGAPPVETSGLIQPPIHARAAWEVYEHAADPTEGRAFLERLYPKLTSWHRYLLTHRDPQRLGLAALVHPWESGLDNSPAWASLVEGLRIPEGALPAYERRDLVHANPADRPTDLAYDRFVYLADTYRRHGYDDETICATSPFLIAGPLFNALLVWSSHALAEIAAELDEDPAPHLTHARRIRAAMRQFLWDEKARRFYSRDLRTAALIPEATIISLTPLADPELPLDAVAAIVSDLRAPAFHPPEDTQHFLVPSYDISGAHFDARRYWRGPVWANTNWLLWRGLRQHGQHALADEIAGDTLDLVERSGFFEYFDPFDGTGYGSDRFSWTAALVIDLLERDQRQPAGQAEGTTLRPPRPWS